MKYFDRRHIDPHKWNLCLESSAFYVPYARFEYLEAISQGSWGALIEGNYSAVFPLVYRRKWGIIPYVYQPYFCQQLGLFGKPQQDIQAFVKAIPWYFFRVHLNINNSFGVPFGARELPNLVKKQPHLPQTDFNKDALKNITRLHKHGVSYTQTKDIPFVLKVYAEAWGEKANLKWPQDYQAFESACVSLQTENLIYACVAYHKHELLGAAIFLIGRNRLHYVCAAPSKKGREIGIMHGIIMHAMEHFPEYDLDFEGSQIPSVAAFYKKFNPINEAYCRIERTLWL